MRHYTYRLTRNTLHYHARKIRIVQFFFYIKLTFLNVGKKMQKFENFLHAFKDKKKSFFTLAFSKYMNKNLQNLRYKNDCKKQTFI